MVGNIMSFLTFEDRRRVQRFSRNELSEYQLARFNALLKAILPTNEFYARKLANFPRELTAVEQLAELPFTTKEDLSADTGSPLTPANLTWPVERYVRYHQTSGTRGRPLPVLDTVEDWQWWVNCWQYVLDTAGVTEHDRAMLAFSFGPFIGFWTAHDALLERGAMVIPGGGMSSLGRLDLLQRTGATVLLCTPTYALHLAEIATDQKINLSSRCAVKKIIVAGEAGGSIQATRARIEFAWQAHITDHSGASEVGAWGFGDADCRGLHVLESEFIAEFVSVETDEPAKEGDLAQLVLTSLGRYGMPVIRYRTGDLVRPVWTTSRDCNFVLLEGGVLGRADDMMVVRGVNVFPSSIEQIMHSFPEVSEYRFTVGKRGEMDEMVVDVEDSLEQPARIAEELHLRLGLKAEVRLAPPASLPRFEGKGRRFIDLRLAENG
jgi:phenylacetate-CoA ligase